MQAHKLVSLAHQSSKPLYRGKLVNFQDKDEIRKLFEEVYPSNVIAGDLYGYADMYTEDALWIAPGDVVRRGPTDIAEGFAAQIAKNEINPSLTAEEIEVIGDFGYIVGVSEAKIRSRDDSESTRVALFRAVWLMRKEQGTWKIARQIWNL